MTPTNAEEEEYFKYQIEQTGLNSFVLTVTTVQTTPIFTDIFLNTECTSPNLVRYIPTDMVEIPSLSGCYYEQIAAEAFTSAFIYCNDPMTLSSNSQFTIAIQAQLEGHWGAIDTQIASGAYLTPAGQIVLPNQATLELSNADVDISWIQTGSYTAVLSLSNHMTRNVFTAIQFETPFNIQDQVEILTSTKTGITVNNLGTSTIELQAGLEASLTLRIPAFRKIFAYASVTNWFSGFQPLYESPTATKIFESGANQHPSLGGLSLLIIGTIVLLSRKKR
ncbi:hypothetical protein JW887_04110 [Candidatus Dojkabacteria bacterium]|nr:hypothetical protein [Candidatus Dojkabacteria bacterium]